MKTIKKGPGLFAVAAMLPVPAAICGEDAASWTVGGAERAIGSLAQLPGLLRVALLAIDKAMKTASVLNLSAAVLPGWSALLLTRALDGLALRGGDGFTQAHHPHLEAQRGNAGHLRHRVGGAEGVEHRGQAVEHAVEGKDVDTHGNNNIKVVNIANAASVAAGLLCAFRFAQPGVNRDQ